MGKHSVQRVSENLTLGLPTPRGRGEKTTQKVRPPLEKKEAETLPVERRMKKMLQKKKKTPLVAHGPRFLNGCTNRPAGFY